MWPPFLNRGSRLGVTESLGVSTWLSQSFIPVSSRSEAGACCHTASVSLPTRTRVCSVTSRPAPGCVSWRPVSARPCSREGAKPSGRAHSSATLRGRPCSRHRMPQTAPPCRLQVGVPNATFLFKGRNHGAKGSVLSAQFIS